MYVLPSPVTILVLLHSVLGVLNRSVLLQPRNRALLLEGPCQILCSLYAVSLQYVRAMFFVFTKTFAAKGTPLENSGAANNPEDMELMFGLGKCCLLKGRRDNNWKKAPCRQISVYE